MAAAVGGRLKAWLDRRAFREHLAALVGLGVGKDLIFVPDLVSGPKGRRAVVLSPHCDDETIGMGGLLRRHGAAGDPVTVVHFTGSVSAAGAAAYAPGTREAEARRAAAVLGLSDLVFLGEPDRGVRPYPALVDRLAGLLREKKPETVYLPWFLDNHADHVGVNLVFRDAWEKWRGRCVVWAYEVWSPLFPNRVVDITAEAEWKKRALAEYRSQQAALDYVSVSLALNRYRAGLRMGGRGYAEAFLAMEASEYLDLLSRWQAFRPGDGPEGGGGRR